MPFLTGGPQLGAWLVVLAGNCKGRGKGSIINIMGCPMVLSARKSQRPLPRLCVVGDICATPRSSRSWEAPR